MRVHFYGKLGTAFGREVEVPVSTPCSVAAVRERLADSRPELAAALEDRRVRAVVGDRVVPDSHQLLDGDEVEFLAPVSGG